MRRHEERALLRRVPFLEAMLPYELERLAQGAHWIEVPAGTAVITQGEPGDSFDAFGEIALLQQVPRTATVRALEDCRLLALSAEHFLATVLPNDTAARLARSIARSRRQSDGDTLAPGATED